MELYKCRHAGKSLEYDKYCGPAKHAMKEKL